MAYTPIQKRRAWHILSVGAKKRATTEELISSMMTALVEANLGNPRQADSHGTSAGWRQEINTYGSEGKRRNVRGAAGRYFDETRQVRGRYKGDPAKLAQAVQRSAYPGRYGQRRSQAVALVKAFQQGQLGKVPAGGGGGGSPGIPGKVIPGEVSVTSPGPGGTGASSILAQLLTASREQPKSSVTAPTPPSHLAKGPLPKGYQAPESSAPPQPKVDMGQLLEAAKGLQGAQPLDVDVTPPVGIPGVAPDSDGGGGHAFGGTVKGGRLVGKPIDRPGVRTSKDVVNLVKSASGWANVPIQVGTGTSHSKMTTSGNVSDHWSGNALDLPATGKKGDRVAGALLVQLGVPRKQARRMAQKGGVFSGKAGGKRWQLLWKTYTGGNHHNHVHVGLK